MTHLTLHKIPEALLAKFEYHVDTTNFFNHNSRAYYTWCVARFGLPLTVAGILASGTLDTLTLSSLEWALTSDSGKSIYLFKKLDDAIQFRLMWN